MYVSVLRYKQDNNNYQAWLLNYYKVRLNNTSTKDRYYKKSSISDKILKEICTGIVIFKKCKLSENWQFEQD